LITAKVAVDFLFEQLPRWTWRALSASEKIAVQGHGEAFASVLPTPLEPEKLINVKCPQLAVADTTAHLLLRARLGQDYHPKDRTPYDDSLYVKSLTQRGSPLAEGLNKPGPDSVVEILRTV
jgi:hypothetical protein